MTDRSPFRVMCDMWGVDVAWKAIVEKKGTAKHTIEKLIKNDDYYSDLFTIEADKIINVRKERAG